MADRIRSGGHDAQAFEQLEDLADAVMSSSQTGDLVLVMGAGDVNRLWNLLQQMDDSDSIAAA